MERKTIATRGEPLPYTIDGHLTNTDSKEVDLSVRT